MTKPTFYSIESNENARVFSNLPTMNLSEWKLKHPNHTKTRQASVVENESRTVFIEAYKCNETGHIFINGFES